jgi:hypothetical protein
MQPTFETDETFGTYAYNMCIKHMQHPDKTIPTRRNTYCNIRQLKHLEHIVATYDKNMQHLDKKDCNIQLKTDETF